MVIFNGGNNNLCGDQPDCVDYLEDAPGCYGCTDNGSNEDSLNPGIGACNYNNEATSNDGSCEYPAEEIYDCDENCIATGDNLGIDNGKSVGHLK